MPELPEVETVLRTLELRIKDQCINDIDIHWDNIIVGPTEDFYNRLKGQHFRAFKRRGKFLIFEMDDLALVSHLRMEGKYYLQEPSEALTKHMHVVFKLDDFEMRYHDTRKFGKMELMELQEEYNDFKNLGVEPFSNEFNYQYCKDYLSKSRKTIKEVLLNQKFIAGIGNIYADEILFMMKVNPARIATTLKKREIEDLIVYTNKILNGAIKAGGTTIRSYTSSLKVTGLFQLSLKVHTLVNEPCSICETKIIKTMINKRGTYYCPKCQK